MGVVDSQFSDTEQTATYKARLAATHPVRRVRYELDRARIRALNGQVFSMTMLGTLMAHMIIAYVPGAMRSAAKQFLLANLEAIRNGGLPEESKAMRETRVEVELLAQRAARDTLARETEARNAEIIANAQPPDPLATQMRLDALLRGHYVPDTPCDYDKGVMDAMRELSARAGESDCAPVETPAAPVETPAAPVETPRLAIPRVRPPNGFM